MPDCLDRLFEALDDSDQSSSLGLSCESEWDNIPELKSWPSDGSEDEYFEKEDIVEDTIWDD